MDVKQSPCSAVAFIADNTDSLSLYSSKSPLSRSKDESENTNPNETRRSLKQSLFYPIYTNDEDKPYTTLRSPRLDACDLITLSQRIQRQESERHRMAKLKKEETSRMEKIQQHDILQQQRNLERSEQARQKIRSKNEATEKLILHTIQSQDLEARQFNEQQQRDTEAKLKSMQDKFNDLKLREEELKKKTVMIESIRTYQNLFRKYADGVCKLLQSLDEATYPSFGADKNQTAQLIKSYDIVIKNINAGILTENEVSIAQQVSQQIEELYKQMLENIKKINEDVAAAQKAKEQSAVVQEQQPAAVVVAAKDTVDTPAITPQAIPQTISAQVSDQLRTFVSPASLQMYEQIKSFYEQYQRQVKPLLDSEPMKKYRFNCQKAINIPVNAISAVNQQHLIDKYEKLAALLSGNVVKAGDSQVSASENPLGKGYCTLLLAKRFVGQADSMISGSLKAAFPIAAVLVALWQKFPDLGILFLHYLFKECPYLIPYFLPQLEGQSPEDYFKSLGYRFTEGAVEKQDQYLKRVAGIGRLYAAILVTRPRCGEQSPHPHNLDNGWRWLTNILNLEPQPDVCATLICEFLQVAGYEMWQCFGKQFVKLLLFIQTKYMPKLNKVDQGGPKARLEAFLNKIITEGKIDPAEGLLSPNFW